MFSQKPAGEADNGAFHSTEIAYTLYTLDIWNRPWTAADRKVENLMSSYWVNFATNGNPNRAGLPAWPPVEPNKVQAMQFSKNSKLETNPLKKEMDVLDQYQALLRNKK